MAIDTTLARASTFYTIDAVGEITNGETIVVAGKTYTFQDTLTDSDGNVHIGADIAATVTNFLAAINLSNEGESAVGAGTDYAASMTRNANVFAYLTSATVLTIYAHVPGEIGNFITCTVGTSGVTLDNATLENGSGNIGDFFDGLFDLNQINAEVQTALRPFSTSVGGSVD